MDRLIDDLPPFDFGCILVLLYICSVLYWCSLHTKLPDYFSFETRATRLFLDSLVLGEVFFLC
jgi:hypothetical protein